MQAQAAGGGGGGESLLQNKKVQIGVIVAGAIAIIAVVCMFIFSGNGGSSDVAAGVNPATTGGAVEAPPGGGPGAYPAPPGGGASPAAASPAGAAPALPGVPSVGAPSAGITPGAGGAPAVPGAGSEATPAKPKAGVPTRANPFEENNDLKAAIKSIPKPAEVVLPETIAPELQVYSELNPPKPPTEAQPDDVAGPPIPPMRVAGVVFGNQVTATLQMGSEFIQIRPGQMIPDGNPVYRVERIEQDRVELVRRYQKRNGDKAVQRFEVTLQGGAQQQRQGAGFYGGGRPGGNGPGGNGPGGNGPLF